MIITEKRVREEEVELAYVCDICEKKYDNIMQMQEFLVWRSYGGYESVFGDDSKLSLDICQHCLKSVLGKYIKIG